MFDFIKYHSIERKYFHNKVLKKFRNNSNLDTVKTENYSHYKK